MEIKSLNHMGLVVEDLDNTRAFYVGFLGMEEISRPTNFKFGGAWFKTKQDDHVHVILAKDTTADGGIPDPGPSKASGLATHFAFVVDDLNAYIERAKELGIEIVGGPFKRGLGASQFYVQDPDGYQVELMMWTDDQESDEVRDPIR